MQRPQTHASGPSRAHHRLVDGRLQTIAIAAIVMVMCLIKYGLSFYPQWFRLLDGVQHWPAVQRAPLLAVGDRALLSNTTFVELAGALHLRSPHAYIGFSIILTVAALLIPFALRAKDRRFQCLYVMALLGGPLAAVLLKWVGDYDAGLVLLLAIATLARRTWICDCAWLLASYTHTAVAVPALVLWAVQSQYGGNSRAGSMRRCVHAGLAVLAGGVAIRLVTDLWGGSTDRFTLFRAIPFDGIVQCALHSLPILLVSALGTTWLLVLARTNRRARDTKVFLSLVVICVIVVPLIAVDETRILALCLVPVTLAWLTQVSARLTTQQVRLLWRHYGLLAALVPVAVVWMGTSYWPYWL